MPDRICSIPDCDRRHEAHGYCARHYQKWYRLGDPCAGKTRRPRAVPCSVLTCPSRAVAKGLCSIHHDRMRTTGRLEPLTVAERLWSKIDKQAMDECWPWIGGFGPAGYGHFALDGDVMAASRATFYIVHGYLPPVVRHTCDNPPCCNPQHLLPGTQQDNVDDMVSRGRAGHGHKLTEDAVKAMRERRDDGASLDEIAAEFNITRSNAWLVVTHRTWRHVA